MTETGYRKQILLLWLGYALFWLFCLALLALFLSVWAWSLPQINSDRQHSIPELWCFFVKNQRLLYGYVQRVRETIRITQSIDEGSRWPRWTSSIGWQGKLDTHNSIDNHISAKTSNFHMYVFRLIGGIYLSRQDFSGGLFGHLKWRHASCRRVTRFKILRLIHTLENNSLPQNRGIS